MIRPSLDEYRFVYCYRTPSPQFRNAAQRNLERSVPGGIPAAPSQTQADAVRATIRIVARPVA